MPRREYSSLSLKEKLEKLFGASYTPKDKILKKIEDNFENPLDDLNLRIKTILNITKDKTKSTDMIFFVMYDIESTKVRNQIVKYLIRQGCYRVQKSIFMAKLPNDKYNKIRTDLATIQSFYDNQDSILVVPISTDLLRSMRIIGKSIDVDLIVKNKNTIYF